MKKMGVSVEALLKDNREPKKKPEEEYIDDVDDLDEKTIRELFREMGLIKKKDPQREKENLFKGIEC